MLIWTISCGKKLLVSNGCVLLLKLPNQVSVSGQLFGSALLAVCVADAARLLFIFAESCCYAHGLTHLFRQRAALDVSLVEWLGDGVLLCRLMLTLDEFSVPKFDEEVRLAERFCVVLCARPRLWRPVRQFRKRRTRTIVGLLRRRRVWPTRVCRVVFLQRFALKHY